AGLGHRLAGPVGLVGPAALVGPAGLVGRSGRSGPADPVVLGSRLGLAALVGPAGPSVVSSVNSGCLADPARLVGLVDSVDAVPVALAGLVGSARPPRSAGRRAAAYARRATRVHARDPAPCPRPATTAAGLRRSEPPPAPGRFVGRGLRCRCRSAARRSSTSPAVRFARPAACSAA